MKLIRLYAENFGVLHNEALDCEDGLNVFCRENGAGKTTFTAFLCAMLYGLPASRKNDITENERKKYQPWQGGPMGGSMTFSVGNKAYRAERYFPTENSSKHDTFVLYDLADNSVSDDYSENLGYELFGLDTAAFERSAYLPQKLIVGDSGTDSITARLNRALDGDAGDAEDGAYSKAAALLDRQRQYYVRHGGKGYLAELDVRLAELHEKEYAANRAKADAERYSAEAEILDKELAQLYEEKQRLQEEQTAGKTRAAVYAHGRSLIAFRDEQLSAAAQKRQFLHLDDAEGIAAGRYGAEAIRTAEQSAQSGARLRDRLSLSEEQIARADAEMSRIASQFANGIPAPEVIDALAHTSRVLQELPADGADTRITLPACFSEEELSRHTGQALMHAQMTGVLAEPQTARDAYRAAMEAAGLEDGDVLPDEDTLQAYADVLCEIAANRERQAQILPQKQEADAALDAHCAQYPSVPAQSEIVVMRSRFDALRGRKEEIEELEARQRLAVQVDGSIRRNRRIRIGLGIGLLVIAAVLCALYGMLSDLRLLIAGAPTAAAGLLLLVIGIMTRSDESDETRALEDAAQKRLCVKKSEYETEKTQIYEFLDCIGADAPAVIDENDAAERFDAASAAARAHEMLSLRAETLGTLWNQLVRDESHLCASLTSYTKSGGGELADIGDDRAVFSEYRKKIAACVQAERLYHEEQKTRAQAQARLDALALVLDRYLQTLEESCPKDIQKYGDTVNGTYSERMTVWCRTADLLRIRMGERQSMTERRAALEADLLEQLDAILFPDAGVRGAASPLACAKEVLSLCAQYGTLTAEMGHFAEQRAALEEQLARCDAQVRQILGGYFDAVPDDAMEGLRIIRAREEALGEDMHCLRQAQKQLTGFLTEHGLTEEMLNQTALPGDSSARTEARLTELAAQIREKTELCAKIRQNAELASQTGVQSVSLRAQIQRTEQMRAEAGHALDVIRTAQTCLEQAKTALSTRYLSYMQARFRAYWGQLMHLTAEKTEALSLDASFAVQTEVLGARREAGYFSRGTQDCISFCVRLAMIDAMYTDGGRKTDAILPPLLLDDPFVNLDGKHLSAARALLDEISERFQILYFVCHESRI